MIMIITETNRRKQTLELNDFQIKIGIELLHADYYCDHICRKCNLVVCSMWESQSLSDLGILHGNICSVF